MCHLRIRGTSTIPHMYVYMYTVNQYQPPVGAHLSCRGRYIQLLTTIKKIKLLYNVQAFTKVCILPGLLFTRQARPHYERGHTCNMYLCLLIVVVIVIAITPTEYTGKVYLGDVCLLIFEKYKHHVCVSVNVLE